jgi:hypothetical protein
MDERHIFVLILNAEVVLAEVSLMIKSIDQVLLDLREGRLPLLWCCKGARTAATLEDTLVIYRQYLERKITAHYHTPILR